MYINESVEALYDSARINLEDVETAEERVLRVEPM